MDAGYADHRRLGVMVQRLTLDGHDLALDDPALAAGWHQQEGAWRWTDGQAAIRVPAATKSLEIRIAPALNYWTDEEQQLQQVD